MNYITFVGLDVHKESISVAKITWSDVEPYFIGSIPNNPDAVGKLVKKLGNPKQLKICYEAGPCGYELQRQLTNLGVSCIIVAPSLVPVKPGERIKTDRRDAKKLARLLRSGDLTSVYVPTREQESLKDLLRAREATNVDILRKRNHLGKFLLRLNIRHPEGIKPWSTKFNRWLLSLHPEQPAHRILLAEYINAVDEAKSRLKRLEQEIETIAATLTNQKLLKALQSLRGVGLITAATFIAEIGDITRFKTAKELMAYVGLVPGEHSSGDTRRQGKITKTGNTHLRFVAVEAGWHYRHNPCVGETLKKRQKDVSPEVKAIAWKAQHRLHKKYCRMVAKGKAKQTAVVAVGRELLGFVWAIANQVN